MTELGEIRSIRTEGDSWDIATSVGSTALMVAAARAVETASRDPLIRDEFAQVLVSSVGPAWRRLASPDLEWLGDDGHGRRAHRIACNYQAVRTHFFDEYFKAAVDDGIRQIVILAAGLDSRAYRLDWPADTTVYEIDQPKVLAYKASTLRSYGARPKATRHAVPVDLRDNWSAALVAAGFDRTRPTAWLAEGLLPYLPVDAQNRLFQKLTALSELDSEIAVEAFHTGSADTERRRAARRARWLRMRDRLGLDINVETLTYQDGERPDAAKWLKCHGWQVQAVDNAEEMARLGRRIPEDLADEAVRSTLLRARLAPAD